MIFSNFLSHTGALSHLTCLQILFLHNNLIRGLEDTMHELRRMQQLQNASESWTINHTHHRSTTWPEKFCSCFKDPSANVDFWLYCVFQNADFSLNPISHELGYRQHVIHRLPSLQIIDGKGKDVEMFWHIGHTVCHYKHRNCLCCVIRSEASREEDVVPDLQSGLSPRPPVCGFWKTPVFLTSYANSVITQCKVSPPFSLFLWYVQNRAKGALQT